MKSRKTWREKMDNPKLPKLVPIPPRMQKRFGTGTMLLPSPNEIEAAMRTIPEGSVTTISQIRSDLAARYQAEVTCPLVTGIFVRIAAEAAEEDTRLGIPGTTPYWRVVRDDGSLMPKFPGGVEQQAQRLRAEGHRIVQGAGKRLPRLAALSGPDAPTRPSRSLRDRRPSAARGAAAGTRRP